MAFLLNLIAIAITATYFVGVGAIMLLGVMDKQKDTTTENRVVAIMIGIGILGIPLIGIIYSLR